METTVLVALALVLGLVVGAAVATGLVLAARTGRRVVASQSLALPSGIEAVIDVLEAPALLVDPSGSLVAASPAAEEVALAADGLPPDVLALVLEVRSSGETVRRELVMHRAGRADQPRYLSVTAALVGARYVLVVAEDHSESVRLDEIRRDFVANISHELKTPIGAISLLSEAVDSAADDPEQVRRFAARMGSEARRLAAMMQDIIALSRVQGLEPVTVMSPLRVDSLVDAAIELHRVGADAKATEIVSRAADEPLLVEGHEGTLVIAIGNLIRNAVQYAPEGTRVGVGVTRRGDMVEIAVTDQGPGIPEEEQERIFERFFRSDKARSRNTGGTGLGLSIVKHAVANHGGVVRVWSQPDSGSTFTIVLPIAPTSADSDAEPGAPAAPEGARA